MTLSVFVNTVALKSVHLQQNLTALSARIPMDPPIAFPSFVENEIQEAITPSERIPVFSQLSSMISALKVKHVIDTTFVTPYREAGDHNQIGQMILTDHIEEYTAQSLCDTHPIAPHIFLLIRFRRSGA